MKNILKWLMRKAEQPPGHHYQEIFTNNSNPMILLSPTGKIIECNDAALTLFGVLSRDFLHRDYFQCCQQYHIPPAFPSIQKLLDNPQSTLTVHKTQGSKKIS